MADRMRVTSLIGGTERLDHPREVFPPRSRGGIRDLRPACASNLLGPPGPFPPPESADDYTTRLATGPRFLRHPARHRAVARPALQRRWAAPHPPVRPVHRTHPGLRRRPR